MAPRVKDLMTQKSLVSYSHPESRIAEQIRNIRSNIGFASTGRKIRSVVLTSSGSGEGKSVVAANLAISLSQRGDKVLLIDAAIRNPSMHWVFNVPLVPGLSDVLAGKKNLLGAIQQTGIGKLDILTCGELQFNTVESLESQGMRDVLETVYAQYEYIVIDTVSVLEAAYTKVLASRCDGVVLVVRNGKTKREAAEEAKRELELAHSNVLGVVFNGSRK